MLRSLSGSIVFLVLGFSCLVVSGQEADQQLWCEYPGGDGPGAGKHIVLISGDEEYRSEEAMPMLGKLLSVRHGFKCTVLFAINPEDGTIDPNNQKNIPGMQHIESADLVMMALRFRDLPDDDMKYLDDHLNAGKPIIGLRTSTHAFQSRGRKGKFAKYSGNDEWQGGFGKHVLGETWVSHHGGHKSQATGGVINDSAADHPILRGVKDVWGPTDVYGIRQLPDDVTILMHGAVLDGMKPDSPPVTSKQSKQNDPMMPLFWVREYETGSRIVCTTMGSSNDLANEGLRRAVVNACYWGLKLEDRISADADMEPVGDFKPTMYGFNSFTKGVKPSDHNLK